MCLYINKVKHHAKLNVDGRSTYIAKKVGRKPILVYKILEEIDGYIQTPYQYLILEFGKDGSVTINGYNFCNNPNFASEEIPIVFEGVHAYVSEKRVIEELRIGKQNEWVFKKFYAIIPSGEEYFVGKDGDIVASKLIVFRTKRHLEKYLNGKETISL